MEFRFEAQDALLRDILFSNRRYRVPRYQRPYSWDKDQATQLWEDLSNDDETYFLGTFIFNLEAEKDENFIDIIDGQQRLLTVTILLAVLRDIAKEVDKKFSSLIQRQDIAIEDRDGNQSFRILPAETIDDFFITYIQKENRDLSKKISPKTAEENRVVQIYDYFFNTIKKKINDLNSSEAKINFLKKIREKIANLTVISVKVYNEEDAYEIFETTNARGVELSIADLLKNLIFKKIKPEKEGDLAKDVWQEINSNIDATEIELKKFIRYFWISRYNFVSEKKLFREIKKQITDWKELLQNLQIDSDCFRRLLAGEEYEFQEFKSNARIYNAIRALRFMGVSQCYVFLLSILRNHKKINFDTVRIFELIEKFTFQYSIVCKLPTNRIERMYSKYAINLEKIVSSEPSNKSSKNVQRLFSDFEKELSKERPSFPVFQESFLEMSYKETETSRKLIKYILARFNAHYQQTDELIIDFNTVNIEHILPKNPHLDWKLQKKDIKTYVNKLGNLTIISKRLNSKAQNSIINIKIKEFKMSELPINRELVNFIERNKLNWNEQTINERQKEMANIAYNKIWSFLYVLWNGLLTYGFMLRYLIHITK